ADVNKADDYGRTPLHVAASADYPEMVRFLIENGADFHVTTKGEMQTPLHFAARNEASQCVKILLAYGATLEVRDYKQRTPLQCSPEGSDYHVIISDEEDQNRKQKEKIALVHTIVSDRLGGKKFGKVQKSEFDTVLEDIGHLKRSQKEMQKSLDGLHLRLEEIGSLNAVIYEEVTKVMQHGKEQMSAIDGVNDHVAMLCNNMEEKFQGLSIEVDLKFKTLETEANERGSALEGNLNKRFDKLETEFKEASLRQGKLAEEITEGFSKLERLEELEQEMTARIANIEAYIVHLEEERIKEKTERKLSPLTRIKSSVGGSPSAFRGDSAKAAAFSRIKSSVGASPSVFRGGSAKAAAFSSSKTPLGSTKSSDVTLDIKEEQSREKQRKRTITMASQAARDEFIARLKETLRKSHEEEIEAEKSKEN
ncbi:PREDICTED: ankyrin repeat and SAM domain-containing protein 4B-like, partial [Acropora digitifera]|uniref:ankyrin repeat and SAM domain-containing protein 4B-like n=1 Tax=Acropora digitifera TaxID=70779 RepID=UPI00077A4D92